MKIKPQFTVRDLVLLTAMVALAIGWWIDHRNLTQPDLAQLTVYSLQYADPASAVATLKALYRGPDVTFAPDTKNNRVIVRAPRKQSQEIEAVLRKLDAAPAGSVDI